MPQQPEPTPEEAARQKVMLGVHVFAAECITLFGEDSDIGRCARRMAQRMRYRLMVNTDPDLEEVRDRVTKSIHDRRERIAALTRK